ncbi:MAG: o-succinylbenzoate synthase [Gammaproteobacteria bacterium]|nr:MAG: o-succinylbenzoate synthase [Gammaproteobacteria bacterium]
MNPGNMTGFMVQFTPTAEAILSEILHQHQQVCAISHNAHLICVNTEIFSHPMTRIQLLFHPYELPLRETWPGSSSSLERRKGWILEIRHDGHRGFGECAPLPETGTENHRAAERQLAGLAAGNLPAATDELARHTPAVSCGIEMALLDLEARRQGVALRRLLVRSPAASFRVNGLSGSACRNHLAKACHEGFEVIKLKVGHGSWEEELRCLESLVPQLPRETRLRLDANGAWDITTAHRFLAAAESLPIESVEEPLAQPTLESLKALQQETCIPLAIDESLHRLDLETLFAHAPVQRLVLKPMTLGGLKRTLQLARRAVEAGMEPVVTSTLESSIGLHALCELASAVESFSPGSHHGLATSEWFLEDLAAPPRIERGRIFLHDRPGIGVTP